MTEAEILEQIALYTDRMWLLGQWYVAISLAVVTATHFAAKSLNLAILIAIISLYSSYAALVTVSYLWNYNVMSAFYLDLFELGPALSEGSRVSMSDPWGPYTAKLIPWIGIAVFIACNAYLIWTYMRENKI